MATRSTIMDTNSFRPEMAAALDPETRKLTEERDVLGPAYRLFYRNPVHLVKGRGSHLWDAGGEEYLDVYNNVASVGHCHPRVVDALTQQASMLNTHTRYLHENILHYAETLTTACSFRTSWTRKISRRAAPISTAANRCPRRHAVT